MSNVGHTIGFGAAFNSDALSKPPLHIPDAEGRPYKTELVLFRSPERTEKINWWHLPDDARLQPWPHNHPWDFTSTILHGGYTERRIRLDPDGSIRYDIELSYRAGDVVGVHRDDFHMVISILPGTVTHMVCGQAREGNEWGYLNLDTMKYEKAQPDPTFLERLRENNKFLIPKP